MSSKSLKKSRNYKMFDDFGQALDKHASIVAGIGQIYADSDRHWKNIRRYRWELDIYKPIVRRIGQI